MHCRNNLDDPFPSAQPVSMCLNEQGPIFKEEQFTNARRASMVKKARYSSYTTAHLTLVTLLLQHVTVIGAFNPS